MAVKTIIFGPTGSVAKYAVQYAASKGAHITLAMRDPSKPIDGLTDAQESAGNFTRVQADLTDATSVHAAASKAKADSAFVYLLSGFHSGLRPSIQALKDAGVKHVVFLSGLILRDPVRSVEPVDYIPYTHAQVEIALEDIFGEGNHISVRAGSFATNLYLYLNQIKAGQVKEAYLTNAADYITPRDIGDVIGYFLAQDGDKSLPRVVYLAGPQLVQLGDALKLVARIASSKELELVQISEEEAVEQKIQQGLPEPIVRYLVKGSREIHEGIMRLYEGPAFEQAQKTVPELLGRGGTTLEQWIEENKAAFA